MCVLAWFVHDVRFAAQAGHKLHRLVPGTALVLAKATLKSDDADFRTGEVCLPIAQSK